ncbi:MAG: hypothetical protein GF411_08595 [Candidatus Lokiarchaeota archaeon]|nr:hypothetical protein [Candidatus Lokiarchaeota archaeon]
MDAQTARNDIISAFNDYYCYSNELPFRYNDFIDGMAWVGLLCGACHIAGDNELIKRTEIYLRTLLSVGADARNFAPIQVKPDWKKSKIGGLYYREKPQSFAGPAGLLFAKQNGADVPNPFNIKDKAEFFARYSNIYGYLLRIPWFGKKYMRQHLNSIMLGCLVNGKKPGGSLEWLCESNPFYAYIGGIKQEVEYPPDTKYSDGEEIEHDEIQPIGIREPSSWIWKQWPTKEYRHSGIPVKKYTPTAYLVAHYLQESI